MLVKRLRSQCNTEIEKCLESEATMDRDTVKSSLRSEGQTQPYCLKRLLLTISRCPPSAARSGGKMVGTLENTKRLLSGAVVFCSGSQLHLLCGQVPSRKLRFVHFLYMLAWALLCYFEVST